MGLTVQIAGWVGTVLILVAYFLLSFNKISATSRNYQLMNLIGAVGLGINVFCQQAWPALVLEIIWGTIAILALLRKG